MVGVARRTDRLEALAAETGADVFTADVTVQADVDALAAYLAELGPVHALVNNAGGAFDMASVEDADPDDWARMFDVNVLGTQRVTAALLPLLRKGIDAEHPYADDHDRHLDRRVHLLRGRRRVQRGEVRRSTASSGCCGSSSQASPSACSRSHRAW